MLPVNFIWSASCASAQAETCGACPSCNVVWTGHAKLQWLRDAVSQLKSLCWWQLYLGGLSTTGLAVPEHRISVITDKSSTFGPRQAASFPTLQAHVFFLLSHVQAAERPISQSQPLLSSSRT
ncbi:hypothetical protein LZ30DRAFT_336328 [Colletotrichum cereale]|nr:hypothetical protein LZ30DRAFT_336328 [Colletotrichum cereale]